MQHKIEEITKVLKKYELKYVEIEDEESLDKIHNLFINNVIYEFTSSIEHLYGGAYYEIFHDYNKMKKHYLIAIKNNNVCICYE